MIRIVVADDHHMVRQGLRTYLEFNPEFSVVGEATNGLDVAPLIEKLQPDILILDLVMPGMDGFSVIQQVRQKTPDTRIIVLSMHSGESYVRKALAYGADAYLVKDTIPADLSRAIHEVMDGRHFLGAEHVERAIEAYIRNTLQPHRADPSVLTRREREVLELAAAGLNNVQIGSKLSISPRTAETHKARAFHKLGLRTQAELVRYALRHGILRDEE
jgi:DNA-binding NarL/FixJ family response regulator